MNQCQESCVNGVCALFQGDTACAATAVAAAAFVLGMAFMWAMLRLFCRRCGAGAQSSWRMQTRKAAEKKPAVKKPAARKPAAQKVAEVIIQSPLGGEITSAEILDRVGKVDKVYVRVDQNKAYWVNGEETGSVDLW